MTCALLFFTAVKTHRLSKIHKNTRKTANPSSALVLSTTPSTVIKGIKSQEIPINVTDAYVHSAIAAFTANYQLKDKTVSQTIRPLLLENTALVRDTNTLSTLRSHSVISKEAQYQTGMTVTYTVGPKGPALSSTRLPVKASVLLTEAKETETADPSPNTTKQNQTSLTVKRGTIESTKAKVNIQAGTRPTVHRVKDNTTPTGVSTSPGLNHAVPTRLPFAKSRGPVTETHVSSVKLRIQTSPINSQTGVIRDDISSQFMTQNSQFKHLVGFQTSSNKFTPLNKVSPSKRVFQPHLDESQTFFSPATLSMPIFKTPTLPTEVIRLSKSPSRQSKDKPHHILTIQPIGELLEPQPTNSVTEPTNKPPLFQTEVPLSISTLLQSGTSSHNYPVQTIHTQTEGQSRVFQTPTSDTPHMYPWSQTFFQTKTPMTQTAQWKRNQIPITWLSSASRSDQKLTLGKDFTPHMSQTVSETISSTFASIPSASPSFLVSSQQLSVAMPVSSFASSRSSKGLAMSSVQTFSSPPSKAPTAARLPNLPTPSPVSIPPHIAPATLPVPTSSTLSPLNSSRSPAHPSSISLSSSSLSSLKSSNPITSSYVSLLSSFTIPPSIFSIDSASPSSSYSSSISASTSSSSISTQDSASSSLASSPSPMFSETTSHHHRPSPVPRRSHNHYPTSTSLPLTSQQPTKKLLIHVTSLEPNPKPNVPTPVILHSPPEGHPNFDPKLKPNFDNKAKLNPAHIDTNLNNPSSTPGNPVQEGKHPDIIPRNSTWVLGMLLGCSACLGMIVVVGLRYMYRQVCGKRTEMTLNDREREYGGGERGLIHVQECGDLVRVRRIRDNSFVFLAEYDILASAGD